MAVLSVSHISKNYGIVPILSDISFHVNEKDKIGLIGQNGAGKTTLLNILSGRLSPDNGEVILPSGITTGYLGQNGNFESSKTIYEEFLLLFHHMIEIEQRLETLSHEIAERSQRGEDIQQLLSQYADLSDQFAAQNGYGYRSEIRGILTSLGFTEEDDSKKISSLSGGEKTRLALGALLLKQPDILFLDEPTNHLDIDTLRWLEQYLKTYTGSVIVISHDRYFLDQTVNRIFEIEHNHLKIYEANYSGYVLRKKDWEQAELKNYEKNQKEIQKQEEMIRRFKQHGTEKLANRAKSREKMLDRTEKLDRPKLSTNTMKLQFRTNQSSGKDVISAEHLCKTFGLRNLFQDISFEVKKEDRICLIGKNGSGKTTLLKIILGEDMPDSGIVHQGHHVSFGYYDQEQKLLNLSNTVLEELHGAYRLYTQKELRNLLGNFLFRGDDVFKEVSTLSGGEKARLSLLKLMLSGANCLIMDEPTNHLDIPSKEVFEDALLSFPGTLFLVSHDRYFLNKLPTRIFELDEEGLTEFWGTYDEYLENKAPKQNSEKASVEDLSNQTKTKLREIRKKEKEAVKVNSIQKKEIRQLEQEILHLEAEVKRIHELMCEEEIFSDMEKMQQTSVLLKETENALESAYEKWMQLEVQR